MSAPDSRFGALRFGAVCMASARLVNDEPGSFDISESTKDRIAPADRRAQGQRAACESRESKHASYSVALASMTSRHSFGDNASIATRSAIGMRDS